MNTDQQSPAAESEQLIETKTVNHRSAAKLIIGIFPLLLVFFIGVAMVIYVSQPAKDLTNTVQISQPLSEHNVKTTYEKMIEFCPDRSLKNASGLKQIDIATRWIQGSLGQSNAGYKVTRRSLPYQKKTGETAVHELTFTLPSTQEKSLHIYVPYEGDFAIQQNAIAEGLLLAEALSQSQLSLTFIFGIEEKFEMDAATPNILLAGSSFSNKPLQVQLPENLTSDSLSRFLNGSDVSSTTHPFLSVSLTSMNTPSETPDFLLSQQRLNDLKNIITTLASNSL